LVTKGFFLGETGRIIAMPHTYSHPAQMLNGASRKISGLPRFFAGYNKPVA